LKYDYLMLLFFPVASYMGAVFTFFMFSFSQHGKIFLGGYSYIIPRYREFNVLTLHIVPVNLVILRPEYFLLMFYLNSLNLKFKVVVFKIGRVF